MSDHTTKAPIVESVVQRRVEMGEFEGSGTTHQQLFEMRRTYWSWSLPRLLAERELLATYM